MSFDFGDGAKRKRDERLRRSLLSVLNTARGSAPEGGLGGLTLLDVVSDSQSDDQQFEGDGHFIALCRDLVNNHLAEMKQFTRRKNEPFAPRHLFMRITAKGTQLIEEQIPPVAGVYDDRIQGEM